MEGGWGVGEDVGCWEELRAGRGVGAGGEPRGPAGWLAGCCWLLLAAPGCCHCCCWLLLHLTPLSAPSHTTACPLTHTHAHTSHPLTPASRPQAIFFWHAGRPVPGQHQVQGMRPRRAAAGGGSAWLSVWMGGGWCVYLESEACSGAMGGPRRALPPGSE